MLTRHYNKTAAKSYSIHHHSSDAAYHNSVKEPHSSQQGILTGTTPPTNCHQAGLTQHTSTTNKDDGRNNKEHLSHGGTSAASLTQLSESGFTTLTDSQTALTFTDRLDTLCALHAASMSVWRGTVGWLFQLAPEGNPINSEPHAINMFKCLHLS